MSVVSVMPEIGVIEIIAIAHADTAANRNAISSVRPVAIAARDVAEGSPPSTEKRKYRKTSSVVAPMPARTSHIGRPRSVRSPSPAEPPPRTSRATSPKACRVACTITGDIFRIERRPAAKIPPMPIGRT